MLSRPWSSKFAGDGGGLLAEFGRSGEVAVEVAFVGVDVEALVSGDPDVIASLQRLFTEAIDVLHRFVFGGVLKPAGTVWATRAREGTGGVLVSRVLFRIAEITGCRSDEDIERDCFTFSKTIHDA
jgi:hypothetical protein